MGNKRVFMFKGIEIPDDTAELFKCELYIEELKKKIVKHRSIRKISDSEHLSIYENTCCVLQYVGDLSNNIFNLRDVIENVIYDENQKNPKLGREIFNIEYEKLNFEYDKLKNRCYNILDDVDRLYMSVNKKYPSNYE